ncbi:MAG: sodium-dependent transporter, partial [Deltaproteobacteria bacterium]|nr:sodium-dependent transporter [Deltaproteobacteria bacterium]
MAKPETDESKKWSRDLFFILACVGAAVGVGNLWRFPYMAYENGGGAFLFPYIICLLLVGVPITLLEIGMGRWGRGSVAQAFRKVKSSWTWIGWWALVNSMVILFYYAVVLGWCAQYVVYSLTEAWGDNPAGFFLKHVVQLTGSPFEFGSLNFSSIVALAVIWGAIFLIVRSGTKGLSRVLLVTVPLPAILLIILAGRSLSMPGSGQGISHLFTPQPSKILNVSVWAAAASQVVLSLSLGMGQIVAYAS